MPIKMSRGNVRTYEPDDGMNRVLRIAVTLTLVNPVWLGLVAYAQTGKADGSATQSAATGGHTFMPNFIASSLSGPAPLTVNFRAVPVGAADASYSWNFNTFIDTPGETASFTFEEPGEHAVTLKVQSGDRLRTATKIVTVTGGERSWSGQTVLQQTVSTQSLWSGFAARHSRSPKNICVKTVCCR